MAVRGRAIASEPYAAEVRIPPCCKPRKLGMRFDSGAAILGQFILSFFVTTLL